jgi:hypothetical protein
LALLLGVVWLSGFVGKFFKKLRGKFENYKENLAPFKKTDHKFPTHPTRRAPAKKPITSTF